MKSPGDQSDGAPAPKYPAGGRNPILRYDLWIVAVPVVFALVLGFALRHLFIYFSTTMRFGEEALFLIEAGPVSVRTTLLVLLVSVAAYAGLWTVIYFREVLRIGWRGVPSEPFAKAVAVFLLFAASVFVTYEAQKMPNAAEFLANAENQIREGNVVRYQTAVRMGVPGVEELCTTLSDDEDADLAFFGAAGLYHRGERSDKTDEILNARIRELKAAAGSKEIWKYEWATHLIQESAPAGMYANRRRRTGLSPEDPFWEWWESR